MKCGDFMEEFDIKRKKEEKMMEALLYTFLDEPNADNVIPLFCNIIDSQVAIPGRFNVSDEDLEAFINSEPDDTVESKSEIKFLPNLLQNTENEKVYYPIFTSSEMTSKEFNDGVSWLVADIDVCIDYINNHKKCSG